MSAKRFGIEALVVIVLGLCGAGVWWWKDLEVQTQARECDARVIGAELEAERWATTLVAGEAAAAFRSFAAGVAPLLLAERAEAVDQAVGGLLELSAVVFVHVLDPAGQVIASSDRKLTTSGAAGESAQWALTTTELTTRFSERVGVLELAAPIIGSAGPMAYLWMGYDIATPRERARPPSLGSTDPSAGGAGAG